MLKFILYKKPTESFLSVSILPQTSELPEGYGVEDGPALPLNLMWLGVVKGIRMRAIDGVDEGFAKIQWFYSKSDARNVVQSLYASVLLQEDLTDSYG